jgi:hypothetical protein
MPPKEGINIKFIYIYIYIYKGKRPQEKKKIWEETIWHATRLSKEKKSLKS